MNTEIATMSAAAGASAYAAKQLLTPVLNEMGQDIAELYRNGRAKLIDSFQRKVRFSGSLVQKINLRIAHSVLSSPSVMGSEMCAEYFGGIMASSVSPKGDDDSAAYYIEVTKSLSSKQLLLHYCLYNGLNKRTMETGRTPMSFDPSWIWGFTLHVGQLDFEEVLQIQLFQDLSVLRAVGLVHDCSVVYCDLPGVGDVKVRVASVSPTYLGVDLYTLAMGHANDPTLFWKSDLGHIPDINVPPLYRNSEEALVHQVPAYAPGTERPFTTEEIIMKLAEETSLANVT